MKITLVSFCVHGVEFRCNCCLQYIYNEQTHALSLRLNVIEIEVAVLNAKSLFKINTLPITDKTKILTKVVMRADKKNELSVKRKI